MLMIIVRFGILRRFLSCIESPLGYFALSLNSDAGACIAASRGSSSQPFNFSSSSAVMVDLPAR